MFLQFCERLEVAPKGINQRLALPDISPDDEVRETMLTKSEAEAILDYCERFEYATLRHALVAVLWHTGMRLSSARALDVDDFKSTEAWLDVPHRPESDTPLKNKKRGERQVNITRKVADVLDDFLEGHHPHVKDDYDRMPLFGTSHGRLHRTTLTKHCYTVSRPCHYSNDCPHGRSREDCEATANAEASKCPSSISPHDIRRGAITTHRNSNVPKDVASDRMDVSGEVLDKHYDMASPDEKRKRRRTYLDRI